MFTVLDNPPSRPSYKSISLEKNRGKNCTLAATFFYGGDIFYGGVKVRIGNNMADEEDHPDSSGKEVRMIFFILLFCFEGYNRRY